MLFSVSFRAPLWNEKPELQIVITLIIQFDHASMNFNFQRNNLVCTKLP